MPSHPVGSLPTLALTIALSVCSWGLALPAAALAPAEQEQDSPVPMLSAQDLDELVGPIALYPDDLVALVLPASTFPLDIVQAARFMQKRVSNPQLEPSQTWDTSVLGLLNYPEIVTLMNDDLDWTQRLGTAVINQQRDVMDAIQDFRQRANAAGNLESDDKQVIVREKETIIIQPASPEVIYVPRYEPAQVVVYQSVPPYYYYPTPYPYYYSPAATFWTGMFVGAAIAYGIGGYRGWNRGDVNINRNVNISGGDRNINISRGGNTWKPSQPAGGRPAGSGSSRPGYDPGSRPGAGGRPDGGRPGAGTRPGDGASRPSAGTLPSTGGGQRAGAGSRPEGGASRPSAGTLPSTGGGQRDGGRPGGAGTRPGDGTSRPSAGTLPSTGGGQRAGAGTRPEGGASRPSAGTLPSTGGGQRAGEGAYSRQTSSRGAFSGSSQGSQASRSSQRGAQSRSAGGSRGGGGGGRGGRR